MSAPLREFPVERLEGCGRDHVAGGSGAGDLNLPYKLLIDCDGASRFYSPIPSRQRALALRDGGPRVSAKSEMPEPARTPGSLTAEEARLWGLAIRFVFILCTYAGFVVGVRLGAG
jgi:hypothetical protein